jgi:MFS family permease
MVSIERNIPLLYGFSIFIKRVSMPIIILYFLLNNLNFTQIGILAAVMAIVALIFEIHGGVFADTYGRRISLLLSSVFSFLTMFFYFIGDSFPFFFIASIIYGLSFAFTSGTRQSLMYDTLLNLKREKEFKKFNGRMVLYSHAVNASVLLAIPLIYVINPKLPFLIGMGFSSLSFMTAIFMIDPPRHKSRLDVISKVKISEAFKEILTNNRTLFVFLLAMITGAYHFTTANFIQPLLLISGLQVIYFGIIYALMRVFMGLGGEIVHRMESHFRLNNLIILGIIIYIGGLLGFYLGAGVTIIAAIILLRFGDGFNRIILEDEINKEIKPDYRTTVLSISGLSKELTTAGLVLSFGFAADIFGVQGMFGYGLTVFVILIILATLFVKLRK